MVVHVHTIALNGIEATPVDVQVHIAGGEAAMTVVGLPSGSVRESRERIRSAFHALGLRLPAKRITVNLSPADVPKEGSHYDLPIAIGLLVALDVLPEDATEQALFLGELGLDGALAPVGGVLPAAIQAVALGLNDVFVPEGNSPEAAWADGVDVRAVNHLKDLVDHLNGDGLISPTKPAAPEPESQKTEIDLADVRGQETAKRALEIAAAGGHNLLMSGPPGSGKSMLASRMIGLLPPLSSNEALDVSMVHSVAGQLGDMQRDIGLVTKRPFRDPHHSASSVALTGGGLKAQPGEMSLAHRGVLFLDELPEFPRQVLETLRQPLETGNITISRANKHVTYPARFQLIAAMNPCPCGYLDTPNMPKGAKRCRCGTNAAERYMAKISGPLLDRFDLQINVPPVAATDMALPLAKEGTKEVAARIAAARERQRQRFEGTDLLCNAELSGKRLDAAFALGEDARALMTRAAERYDLSARGYHRVFKSRPHHCRLRRH